MPEVATVGLISSSTEVAVYKPFMLQLAKIKKTNASFVFDFSDPKQNKEARSHIYKLRQTKAAIEKARKEEKAASLGYCRKVDEQAEAMKEEVEEMIELHDKPLQEWEAEESARIDAVKERLAGMVITADFVINKTSDELRLRLDEINAIDVEEDENWGKFGADAIAAKIVAIEYLSGAIGIALKRESEAAELQRLRDETEARRIADEAAATKAENVRIERERVAREAQEKAIQDERVRIEREDAAKKAKDAERQADKAHCGAIYSSIIKGIVELGIGITEQQAKNIVVAICGDQIPELKILY